MDNMITVGKKVFIKSSCHFIFILFMEGNIVSAAEYVSCV